METFSPISYDLFDFLTDLEINNNRQWFAEQKTKYSDVVLTPAVNLCRELEIALRACAPHITVQPKPYRGSVMRVYRDTRFTKDKKPFKTNVGIFLRHEAGRDIHAPGIYIHLEPRNCFIGFGCWKPDRVTLSKIRRAIVDRPTAWKRVVNRIHNHTELEIGGNKLIRGPRDLPKDHPCIEDLKRTDFILSGKLQEQDFVKSNPIPTLIQHVDSAKPWMRFLCHSMDLNY